MSGTSAPAARQEEPTSLLVGRVLPAILFATKLGLIAGVSAYFAMAGVSSIDTFASGALTATGIADKGRDYAAALSFVVIALATFIGASEALRWTARLTTARTAASLRDALLLANIPAAFALGQIILSRKIEPDLVLLSSAAELVVLASFAIFLVRASRRAPTEHPGSPFPWVLAVLLFASVAGANAPAGWAAWFLARGDGAITRGELVGLSWWGGLIGIVLAALACAAIFATSDGEKLATRLQLLALFAQGALLAALVRIVGPLAFVDGRLQYLVVVSNAGTMVLVVLGLASAVHLATNVRSLLRGPAGRHIGLFVTPVAAALLALLIKLSPDLPLLNIADDYHTGEYALPYWALKTFGLVPYVDLSPARGWINLLNGFIAEEWLDGTYASYPYSHVLLTILVLGLLFTALRILIGTWPALFVTCLAPATSGLSEINLFMTAVLVVLSAAAFRLRPTAWLALWVVLGTIAVLVAPGQGGLLVLATGILGAAIAFKAAKDEPRLLLWGGVLGIIAVALLAATPLREVVAGAVRYGLEQSSVNSEENGIAWIVGVQASPVTSGILWELARSSWLCVTTGIGIAIYIVARGEAPRASKVQHLVLGVPIVVLGLLFIFRAGGRIDAGEFSRLGDASQWFACVLLPVYVLFQPRKQPAVQLLLLLTVAGAAITFEPWVVGRFGQIKSMPADALVDGAALGVPALGRARIDMSRAENYAALKSFADSHAAPGEPILDLTNRNSVAYLLDRPPAIEVAAYNLSSPVQQERVVRALAAKPPPLVLADSFSIRHDGGVVGLRANPLFRFVVENYEPVEANGSIWMLRRRANGPAAAGSDTINWELLDRSFAQRDLGHLPRFWGEVWKICRSKPPARFGSTPKRPCLTTS